MHYNVKYKTSSDMKKQINDLLLKMQTGENCIGETANKLLDLYSVSVSLPTRQEMDKEVISIMSDNLQVGTGQEEGIICNKFATSLKIVDYIEKITGNER